MTKFLSLSMLTFGIAGLFTENGFSRVPYTAQNQGYQLGTRAAQKQRSQDYLEGVVDENGEKHFKGAYCQDNMQEMLAGAIAAVPIEAVPEKRWGQGTEYGTFLQNYFKGVCDVYAGQFSFSGAAEPCGDANRTSKAISQGLDAAERVAKKYALKHKYCSGDKYMAGGQARASFIEAMTLEKARDQEEYIKIREAGGSGVGVKLKDFVRGFARGLCAEHTSVSCESHAAKDAIAEFEPAIKKSGANISPDATATLEIDEKSRKKNSKKPPENSPAPPNQNDKGNEAG